ncbi:heavy metal translocating P-type ATPase [Patescibacteria group bacterium]|nr:heavy metal translocating P-type ATPase [Patescibacteria group bacterium]MBU1967368.1 heavy metal translocating P-type ATPase [Patescibacteria group bacterium]
MPKNNQTLSFHVSGMHCASCASNITRKLNKTLGVEQASVNYANEQATVTFDEKKISTEQLADAVSFLGYTAHFGSDAATDVADQERAQDLKSLKTKLVVSGILVVILIASMIPDLPMIFRNLWLLWLLATPVQFWAGKRFYQGAWSGLKNKTANMDTLVALGTSVAYFYSVLVVFFGSWLAKYGVDAHVYFEASSAIIAFILLGKFLEIRAKAQTSFAIKELLNLQAKTALVKKAGQWLELPISEVLVGDILLVKPGQKIPVDGEVVKGNTSINESMVTGESLPVSKKIGDTLVGATINRSGSIEMRATKVGNETMLANIVRLVKEAQGSRPPIQALVDTISAYFVPVVILIAIITFIGWMLIGPQPRLVFALISMINVLIIACPCALGLATPTSLMVGMGRGAKLGVLIKDAQALEVANKVKAVVFDKTGTLTEGKPVVQEAVFIDKSQQTDILVLLKNTEELSHHPLAGALVEFASSKLDRKIKDLTISNFHDVSGKGVTANVDKKQIVIGNEKLLQQQQINVSQEIIFQATKLKNKGHTVVFMSVEKHLVAIFSIADSLKKASSAVVESLSKSGITSIMLTGDNQQTAKAIAKEAGINEVIAEVLPADKERAIRKLREKYPVVAMVGDGINDAPALAIADVGIAMGGGTDVAIESAGVTLLRSDISLVPIAINLSKATMRNIRQNLFWAFSYNIILIPVAMGVLYPFWGVLLNPILAGAAMALSSVSVVFNALRLKTVKL